MLYRYVGTPTADKPRFAYDAGATVCRRCDLLTVFSMNVAVSAGSHAGTGRRGVWLEFPNVGALGGAVLDPKLGLPLAVVNKSLVNAAESLGLYKGLLAQSEVPNSLAIHGNKCQRCQRTGVVDVGTVGHTVLPRFAGLSAGKGANEPDGSSPVVAFLPFQKATHLSSHFRPLPLVVGNAAEYKALAAYFAAARGLDFGVNLGVHAASQGSLTEVQARNVACLAEAATSDAELLRRLLRKLVEKGCVDDESSSLCRRLATVPYLTSNAIHKP